MPLTPWPHVVLLTPQVYLLDGNLGRDPVDGLHRVPDALHGGHTTTVSPGLYSERWHGADVKYHTA